MVVADCQNCNALLSPDAAWCLQCHHVISGREAPGTATAEPTERRRALRPQLRPRQEIKRAEYSRWKGGPTSFGPATKVILTVIILAFAPVSGALGMQLLYLIAYLPIALILLWGIWRKQQVG